MTIDKKVNTITYWDGRFSANWEKNNGPLQSEFFAKLAIEHMPSWFLEQFKRKSMTIVDWGCAQGDGTFVWTNYVDTQQIVGVDFSSVAIKQASERYPAISFKNEDWLGSDTNQSGMYDVVFSSNTLEHFHNPYDVLDIICRYARKAIVLALPYRETENIQEHFFNFRSENIPIVLKNYFRLVWARVTNCKNIANTQWAGYQIFLVYADPEWVDSLGLTLKDVQINDTELDSSIDSFERVISELDAKITAILSSTSWRLTRPMRLYGDRIKRILSLLRIAPQIIAQKGGIWRTCGALLHICRYEGLASIKLRMKIKNLQAGLQSTDDVADLRWDDFKKKVLSFRENYKGIFVMEATVDWYIPLYQRPQHLATALGKLGYLVIYKTHNLGGDNIEGFREVATNVWVTNRTEVDEIDGAVHSFYSTSYIHTPESLLRSGNRGTIVYEYIDHIDPEISGDEKNIERLIALKDFAFGGEVSFIVASARRLYDEAVSVVGKEKVLCVPNGVDTRHYRNSIHQTKSLPDTLTTFRKKYRNIVGYFGAIAPWLWYKTISELVKKRSDIGFIFIGPDYKGGVKKLPHSKNFLYLGTVDYGSLPAYARLFDVCFIPFKPGEIASTTSPLKLFEYFALEKPVVVTSEMMECVAFPEVFSGDSADTLSTAIDQAVSIKNDHLFKARLAQLADENSWEVRAKQMEKIFPQR